MFQFRKDLTKEFSNSLLGETTTSVGEELKYNPRLTKSKQEFVKIMEGLGLTRPSKMGNHLDSIYL